MNNKAKTALFIFFFAAVYSLVLQQGILLLTDYFTVKVDTLVFIWQSYLGLFIFNLLVAQTTRKYFKANQRLYFSIMVGCASALLPTVLSYDLSAVWSLLLANSVISIMALLAQSKLETMQSKSQ
jgi:hypothetical protein